VTTVQDIITILDDHGFTDTDTNTKLAYLQWAITQFCAMEPWPFLEATATLTFTGSSSTPVTAPPNFRAVRTLNDASTGRKIMPERLDTLENAQGMLTTQLSDPLFYYIEAGQLNLAPIPPASFTGKLRYLQFQPDVNVATSSLLIPNRYWMVLAFGALSRLYAQDDDMETSLQMQQVFKESIGEIRDEIWREQFDMGDYVVMTDPDYLIDFPI
jgi:hypothetical protein